MIIAFYDEETTYALIEPARITTDADVKTIKDAVDEYRNLHKLDYDIDGFLDWLEKDKKVKFKTIQTEADYNIYF